MTDGDKPNSKNEPADEEQPFWALSREDQRLLWVTFIGGVASFIVGAVIIGVAIALARRFSTDAPLLAIITLGSTCVLGVLYTQARRRGVSMTSLTSIWLIPILVAVPAACLLIWIGIAAGIK
jgi:4-amino-4-deoxy-L-arabinose transferase-like glycosyltransferase